MPNLSASKQITLNYKDLVWNPSFEEDEVETPLMAAAPMMAMASPMENIDGPVVPGQVDESAISFE